MYRFFSVVCLSDFQLNYLSFVVYVEFEVCFEIAPGVAVKLSVDGSSVVFHFIDSCKTFVSDGFGRELFKVTTLSVIHEFGIFGEKGKP